MTSPSDIIYLDNNATTQLDPAALEEMLPFLTTSYGNPSSAYHFGTRTRGAMERARERVAVLLGCAPAEIVFTSGGTEATNTAIHSALQLDPARQHIVTTAVEHSATLRTCELHQARGGEVTFLGVDEAGELNLEELEQAIRPDTALLSETGVLFPIREIAEIAQRHRVLFHTDAVQAAGKIPLQLGATSINFCSISAHKLHGPKGVGCLYVSRRSAFRPLLLGGGQENGRRSGTENPAAIVGFGKAAQLAHEQLATSAEYVRQLRDRFEQALLASVPDVTVNGGRAERLPNTSSLAFAGIESDTALLLLDRQRLCCSAGSACSSGAIEISHVLRAMGLAEKEARGSIRFSFSRFNRERDVERAAEAVCAVVTKLRRLSAPNPTVAR